MEEEIKSLYIKRSQNDYPLSFKMSVVREVESGGRGICAVSRKYDVQSETTVSRWLRKYGNFDRDNRIEATMVKSPAQNRGQSVATYNGLRPHLSCGMLTPNQMHRQ
ncbi:MAG: hypothetical protein RR037_05390, partial [Alistipes sp.]